MTSFLPLMTVYITYATEYEACAQWLTRGSTGGEVCCSRLLLRAQTNVTSIYRYLTWNGTVVYCPYHLWKCVLLTLSCSQTVCDWRWHSDSIQLRAIGGAPAAITLHYYYCVMRGSCIGMDVWLRHRRRAGSKACIAGYSAVQTYITAI